MTDYANNTLVDTDPDSMFKEIQASEKSRESHLCNYDKLLRNAMASEEWPEALTFEYLSYMIPRIVQENPTVEVSSRIGSSDTVIEHMQSEFAAGQQLGLVDPAMANPMLEQVKKPGMDALAGKHGLKRWIEQEDYRVLLDRHVDNYLKAFSASVTRPEPMRGHPANRWPKTYMVDPRRMLLDPVATHLCESAWMGHWDVMPKKALEMRAAADPDGWDLAAIKELSVSANDRAGVNRHDIRLYELWVPGLNMNEMGDPDIHGAWITLAAKSDGSNDRGVEIRKPRPAYVPPWGPYTMFGCYNKTGSPWPTSPLLATFAEQDELQKHARAMNINARQYKRVVLVSDSNPALVNQLRAAPDYLVIPVKDDQFTKDKVIVVEMGGISDQQLTMYTMMKGRIDRALGMDDSQRGKVDTDATATAVAVADESVATRVSYIEGKFIAAVRNNLRTVLWYMMMDERCTFRLGREAAEAFGMIDPWFQGGLQDGEAFDFDDLEMVIDPYSMGRVSEQALQRRVNEFVQTLVSLAPVMMQMQFIDWKAVIKSLTQVLNLPNMEGVINFEQMAQMGQMQLQMGMQQQATEMDGQKVANDAGRVKNMSNAMQLIQNRVGGNPKNFKAV